MRRGGWSVMASRTTGAPVERAADGATSIEVGLRPELRLDVKVEVGLRPELRLE